MKTHNMSAHPIYTAWENMKTRCNNINCKEYKYYGGRGIKVCAQWIQFESFMNDMLPSWKAGLELDRIDNNLGYSPDNCRWATKSEQQLNKRPHGNVPYRGVVWDKTVGKYRARITRNGKRTHLGRFNTAIEASEAYENARRN